MEFTDARQMFAERQWSYLMSAGQIIQSDGSLAAWKLGLKLHHGHSFTAKHEK